MKLAEQIEQWVNDKLETYEYELPKDEFSIVAEDIAKEVVKLFAIHIISQQRELLKAFADYHNENFEYEKIYEDGINKFLNSLQ